MSSRLSLWVFQALSLQVGLAVVASQTVMLVYQCQTTVGPASGSVSVYVSILRTTVLSPMAPLGVLWMVLCLDLVG